MPLVAPFFYRLRHRLEPTTLVLRQNLVPPAPVL
jgi:hypothetical protein